MTARLAIGDLTAPHHPPGALRVQPGANDAGPETLAAQLAQAARPPLSAFQIGMHWFPERAGGLDRMYHALTGALPAAGVEVRGRLAGSGAAAADTHGAIKAFAPADASVPMRLLRARRTLRAMLAQEKPDVIASHFALYTLPGLDLIRDYPTVMHFHGPWAAENQAEGVADASSIAWRLPSMRAAGSISCCRWPSAACCKRATAWTRRGSASCRAVSMRRASTCRWTAAPRARR
jgi:hypothetical protein